MRPEGERVVDRDDHSQSNLHEVHWECDSLSRKHLHVSNKPSDPISQGLFRMYGLDKRSCSFDLRCEDCRGDGTTSNPGPITGQHPALSRPALSLNISIAREKLDGYRLYLGNGHKSYRNHDIMFSWMI